MYLYFLIIFFVIGWSFVLTSDRYGRNAREYHLPNYFISWFGSQYLDGEVWYVSHDPSSFPLLSFSLLSHIRFFKRSGPGGRVRVVIIYY